MNNNFLLSPRANLTAFLNGILKNNNWKVEQLPNRRPALGARRQHRGVTYLWRTAVRMEGCLKVTRSSSSPTCTRPARRWQTRRHAARGRGELFTAFSSFSELSRSSEHKTPRKRHSPKTYVLLHHDEAVAREMVVLDLNPNRGTVTG